MGIRGFLTTLGLGLGAMYFVDPEKGEQRRINVRQQVVQLRGEAQNVWTQGSEDLANRARGVRNKVNQAPADRLEAGKEALSGGRDGMKLHLDMNRPGDRLLTMSGGGLVALYGLARGGLLGKLALLAGANYVAKGLVQKDVLGDAVTRLRSSSGGAGIEFRKAIRINAPVEEVFAFWQNYENFPRFMSHLKEVRDLGETSGIARLHWVTKGPGDMPVEWDAMITELRPNRVLAWESVPGSEVYNAGRVRFESVDGATRVDVFMTYNPPGGVAGHAILTLFDGDPGARMDDDLLKLKSLLEQTGELLRPGYSYRRSSGGDHGMAALGDEIGGDSETSGLSGGENMPSGRKPDSDTPGAAS